VGQSLTYRKTGHCTGHTTFRPTEQNLQTLRGGVQKRGVGKNRTEKRIQKKKRRWVKQSKGQERGVGTPPEYLKKAVKERPITLQKKRGSGTIKGVLQREGEKKTKSRAGSSPSVTGERRKEKC